MNTRRVKRIDELARDVAPARDLWPAIAAAIEADKAVATTPSVERRRNWWPAPAVAAAIALVAVGVLIGRQMTPEVVVTAATHTAPANDAAALPAAYEREAKYQKVREELLADVQERLETMPPEEREKVAASLATLRRSIGEIEAALGRDPANALLQELLVSSRQEEMRALTVVRDSGRQEI
jgi:hypothetical protein